MVKVIMGLQGHGKTKQIIELANAAVKEDANTVVCIERGDKLKFDISHRVRLVDVSTFPITSYERLKAFICGMYSGNFDISDIFIDSLYKVAKSDSVEEAENFLLWLEEFGATNNINFVTTISADEKTATETVKKFF